MKKTVGLLLSVVLLSACVSTTENNTTSVYINNGAIQCESTGKRAAETADLLKVHQVDVLDTQCANLTDVAVIAMCGGPTTQVHIHRIASNQLDMALALGFESLSTLKQGDNLGYRVKSCP